MCHYTPVGSCSWATAVGGMSGMVERDSGMAASAAGAGPGVDEPSVHVSMCACMHKTLPAATC